MQISESDDDGDEWELARDTIGPALDAEKDIVILPCSDTKEKRISCVTGGFIELHGCKITVPPRSLEVDSTIKVTVESGNVDDRSSEYMNISPTIDCDLSKVQLKQGSELEVEMRTICCSNDPIEVHLLSRILGSPEWVKERRLTLLSHERKLVFKTAHSSRKCFAILRYIGLGHWVKFPILPHLYYKPTGLFHCYFCIDDKLVDAKLKEEHRNRGFQSALIMPQCVIARIGDKIKVHLQCDRRDGCFKPEEPWEFTLSEDSVDSIYVFRGFTLGETSARLRQGDAFLYFLRGLAGTDLQKIPFALELPPSLPDGPAKASPKIVMNNPKFSYITAGNFVAEHATMTSTETGTTKTVRSQNQPLAKD